MLDPLGLADSAQEKRIQVNQTGKLLEKRMLVVCLLARIAILDAAGLPFAHLRRLLHLAGSEKETQRPRLTEPFWLGDLTRLSWGPKSSCCSELCWPQRAEPA